MLIHWPSVRRQLTTIVFVSFCASLIIIFRLFYLQIILGDIFFSQGEKNFLRTERIPSPRGDIVDSKGRFLATNQPTADLYWQGTGKKKFDEAQKKVIDRLINILGIPEEQTLEFQAMILSAERSYQPILMLKDLSFDQLSKIQEQFPETTNIFIKNSFRRYYPYGAYASHVVGYLGQLNMELSGKMGLEQIYQQHLQGEQGVILKTINSIGKKLNQQELKESQIGKTIQVTIDIDLQSAIEKVFPENLSGTCIIMDPSDGSLKALVSRPHFDPSSFLKQITHGEWQLLQENQRFLNRALNATYPPGSIFKLVTTAAALEHDIIKPEDSWYCKGYVTFAHRQYWCANRAGHGSLSARKGLAKSCNTMFFDIAKRIDIDALADYAYRFGLGRSTALPFAQKNGLIPSKSWKQAAKGERWWPGETLSAAIGQSYLLVTPIQIARMISGIFTGYLVKPRILVEDPIDIEPLNIKPETLTFLRKSMKSAIKMGTAQKLKVLKNFEIYAKTSTAQTSAYNKRCLGSVYLEHGWCVAHFKYNDNEPLVMVLLVEHAGTSRVATDIIGKFLLEYRKLCKEVV